MKGVTRWYKTKETYPVRPGWYECGVRITSAQRSLFLWMLFFDGKGFLCEITMTVPVWRGMTKKAAQEQLK